MKTLFLFLPLFLSLPAQARVEARFVSFFGMISVTDRVMGRVTDDDPQRLSAVMNVEEEERGGRRAKAIRLEGKKFVLVCSAQGADQTVCTIMVKAGAQGVVDPVKKRIRFVALGQEAFLLHRYFHVGVSGRMDYASADGSLRLSSDGSSFVAEYRGR